MTGLEKTCVIKLGISRSAFQNSRKWEYFSVIQYKTRSRLLEVRKGLVMPWRNIATEAWGYL